MANQKNMFNSTPRFSKRGFFMAASVVLWNILSKFLAFRSQSLDDNRIEIGDRILNLPEQRSVNLNQDHSLSVCTNR